MDFSLYFHVPFCQKKCPYCHFYSVEGSKQIFDDFIKALKIEWELQKEYFLNKKLLSLYFGGGTPSLLGPKRIQEIISFVQKDFSLTNVEITLEINPNIDLRELLELKKMGVNRLSIGVQSFDDSLLNILQRGYDAKEAKDVVIKSFDSGIENLSIDLLYDIPKQTLKIWENTLKESLSFPLSHLSIYNLVFEPNTPFFRKKDQFLPHLPSNTTSLNMIKKAQDLLFSHSFYQYEISAFAKKNKHSIHNSGYWTGRNFLGFGPSAFSYISPKRFKNISNLFLYLKRLFEKTSPIDFEEELKYPENLKERLIIALRQKNGINVKELEKLGKLPQKTVETLTFLEKKKLLSLKEEIKLTPKGFMLYDSIALELI